MVIINGLLKGTSWHVVVDGDCVDAGDVMVIRGSPKS